MLDFDPGFRPTRAVNRCEALRHDALQSKIAHGLKQFFAVTFGVLNVLDATTRGSEVCREPTCAHETAAVADRRIERTGHRQMIGGPTVQRVDAIHRE